MAYSVPAPRRDAACPAGGTPAPLTYASSRKNAAGAYPRASDEYTINGNDSAARIRYVRSRTSSTVPTPQSNDRTRYHSQCRTAPMACMKIETSGWFVSA
jgi:hypothetical protein